MPLQPAQTLVSHLYLGGQAEQRIGFLRGQGVLRSNLSKSQGLHLLVCLSLSQSSQHSPASTPGGTRRVRSQVWGGFVDEELQKVIPLEGKPGVGGVSIGLNIEHGILGQKDGMWV